MELIGLKTFKAVVDEAGIKGASEKLHGVQSNITSLGHWNLIGHSTLPFLQKRLTTGLIRLNQQWQT